jgi:hypothetical protein
MKAILQRTFARLVIHGFKGKSQDNFSRRKRRYPD